MSLTFSKILLLLIVVVLILYVVLCICTEVDTDVDTDVDVDIDLPGIEDEYRLPGRGNTSTYTQDPRPKDNGEQNKIVGKKWH